MQSRVADAASPKPSGVIESETLLVAAAIYGGWMALTLTAAQLSPLLVAALGGWLLAWHGSLQHETIHGHPTPSRRFNKLLGYPPLSLWLPYPRYRQLHLAHHATERLTFPVADPESRYVGVTDSAFRRAVAALTATLLGRLTAGPIFEIGGFLASEAKAVARNEPGVRLAWAIHLAGTAAIIAWLVLVCRLSLSQYLLCFVYPGAALSLLRSFAEHRADPDPERRVAVVEKAPVLSLLFLNNNLHAVHHAFPAASWRQLPGLYAHNRTALLSANGGLVYDGYREVAARYLFKPHDVLVHPEESPRTRAPVAA